MELELQVPAVPVGDGFDRGQSGRRHGLVVVAELLDEGGGQRVHPGLAGRQPLHPRGQFVDQVLITLESMTG